MAITKPRAKNVEEFIAAAPDAASDIRKPNYVRKGKKLQITLTIAQPLLERVDKLADKLGQSRAGIINLALYQSLESGLQIDGEQRDEIKN